MFVIENAELTVRGNCFERPSIQSYPLPHVVPCLGRDREMSILVEQVASPHVHVYCVHGLPGVGKTMLVKAAVYKLVEYQGVNGYEKLQPVYISLVDHGSQDQCVRAILEGLGEDPKEGQEFTHLQSFLQENDFRGLVLILDACDKAIRHQLVQFHSLLSTLATSVKIITTSLTSYQSRELEVCCLQLKPFEPDVAQSVLCSLCDKGSKITIKKGTAKQLVELCDYMPIAIQIIAAVLRTRLFAPQSLLTYLHDAAEESTVLDNLDKLATHTVNPDHRVSACFEAAYSLLPQTLQHELTLLSLFQGSFSDKACATVLGIENKANMLLKVLGPLQQCSLLEPGKGNRYGIHGSIVEFLRAKFARLPQDVRSSAVNRYCLYYSKDLGRASEHFLDNPRQSVLQFDKNRGNYEQLLQFAVPAAIYDDYMDLIMNSEGLLRVSLSVDQRCELFEACAKAAKFRKDYVQFATSTLCLADSQLDASNTQLARECLGRIAVREAVLSDKLLIRYRILEASVMTWEGDPAGATKQLINDCFKEDSTVNSYPMLKGKALVALGNASVALDDRCAATEQYEQAKGYMIAAFTQPCQDSDGPCPSSKPTHPDICSVQLQIAHCYFQIGNYSASESHFLEALAMQGRLSCDRLSRAITSYHIGISQAALIHATECIDQSQLEDAVGYLGAARDEAIRLSNNHPLTMVALLALGNLLFRNGLNMKRKLQKEAQQEFRNALEHFAACTERCRDSADWKDSTVALEALSYQAIIKTVLRSAPKSDDVSKMVCRCVELAQALSPNGSGLPSGVQYVLSDTFPACCTSLGALRVSFAKFNSNYRYSACMMKRHPLEAKPSSRGKLRRRFRQSKSVTIVGSTISSTPLVQAPDRGVLVNLTAPSPERSPEKHQSGRTRVLMHREQQTSQQLLPHGSGVRDYLGNLATLSEEDEQCSSSEVSDVSGTSPTKSLTSSVSPSTSRRAAMQWKPNGLTKEESQQEITPCGHSKDDNGCCIQ